MHNKPLRCFDSNLARVQHTININLEAICRYKKELKPLHSPRVHTTYQDEKV
jgi:hypothetical protein